MKEMVVVYHRPSVGEFDGVKLVSGANTVDVDLWAKAAKHPVVKSLVEEGVIEFKAGEVGKAPPAPSQHLKDMKPKEAMELVGQTINADILAGWAKEETREPVKKAIAEQQKKLQAPTELRERSQDQK